MSKKLEKEATRLVRKAEDRALVIRRVMREYRDSSLASEPTDPSWHSQKQREIEQAVGRYNEVHKALKRIRKRARQKRVA